MAKDVIDRYGALLCGRTTDGSQTQGERPPGFSGSQTA